MPFPLTKTSDEWSDINRALGGYTKLMDSLRKNDDREINQYLDEIETRTTDGEDFQSLLQEYSDKKPIFKQWVSDSSSTTAYKRGQRLSGVDVSGNNKSGTYVRSVLGCPEVDTGDNLVVLWEVE